MLHATKELNLTGCCHRTQRLFPQSQQIHASCWATPARSEAPRHESSTPSHVQAACPASPCRPQWRQFLARRHLQERMKLLGGHRDVVVAMQAHLHRCPCLLAQPLPTHEKYHHTPGPAQEMLQSIQAVQPRPSLRSLVRYPHCCRTAATKQHMNSRPAPAIPIGSAASGRAAPVKQWLLAQQSSAALPPVQQACDVPAEALARTCTTQPMHPRRLIVCSS